VEEKKITKRRKSGEKEENKKNIENKKNGLA
jgi:hypothetical protein